MDLQGQGGQGKEEESVTSRRGCLRKAMSGEDWGCFSGRGEWGPQWLQWNMGLALWAE